MSYRPSKAFLLCLVPMLATGAAGAWAWNKAAEMPAERRQKTSFFRALRYEVDWTEPILTSRQREKVLPLIKAEMDKAEREFPALKLTERPVPDERNGFLQLYKLAGPPTFGKAPSGKEFHDLLEGGTPWDPVAAKRLLAENAPLVARVEAIAALGTRSSSNMPPDYTGFFEARTGRCAVEILLVKARLAAEAKDEPEALHLVAAALNLAAHYSQVEAPSLLAETVAILLDLEVHRIAFTQVLPLLGREADLPRWKTVLTPRAYTPEAFAVLMRAEWQTSCRFMLMPYLFNDENPARPSDGSQLIRILASHYNQMVTCARSSTLGNLNENMAALGSTFQIDPTLSKKSQKLETEMFIGVGAWSRGYVRAATVTAQYQAALDLLIQEKTGTVAAGPALAATRDPVTGEPFAYDPVKRVLNPPSSAVVKTKVEPLILPW